MNGKACVVRSICEAKTHLAPPGKSLVHDILRAVFTYVTCYFFHLDLNVFIVANVKPRRLSLGRYLCNINNDHDYCLFDYYN